MQMRKTGTLWRGALLAAALAMTVPAAADWLKLDPPPDVDKHPNVDLSCYLATAANVLAGAGYGNGSTVQDRAVDIYDQLKTHFDAFT